jgi:hypothetical protein
MSIETSKIVLAICPTSADLHPSPREAPSSAQPESSGPPDEPSHEGVIHVNMSKQEYKGEAMQFEGLRISPPCYEAERSLQVVFDFFPR